MLARIAFMGLALLVAWGQPASADVVATGDLVITVDLASSAVTGTVTFDDAIYAPFGGGDVDLGFAVGSATLSGTYAFGGEGHGSFAASLTAGDAAALDGQPSGSFVCADASCQTGTTFVGQFAALAGGAIAGLPSDAVYSFDGVVGVPVVNGTLSTSTGRLSINAFRPAVTPASAPGCDQTASCGVPVDSSVGYVLPDGTAGTTTVSITYPKVLTAGETTVSALSGAAGELPSDVALDAGGYRATYFELATTADVDLSNQLIEVCIAYDLNGTGLLASQLRFLHRENDVFVDRTSRLDESAQVVCGMLPSFSPVVLAVTLGCTTDASCSDGNPCTDDTCNAFGVCLHQLPSGCATPTKATLKMKDSTDNAKDKLTWKFKGPGTNFGAPDVSTSYALCVINGSGTVVLGALAPAAGTCGTKPCWTVKNGKAKYKDKDATPNGLTAIVLKANTAGVASLTVKGKGSNLNAPAIPVTTPVTAALRRLDASACWSTTFATPSRNANGTFSGKQ